MSRATNAPPWKEADRRQRGRTRTSVIGSLDLYPSKEPTSCLHVQPSAATKNCHYGAKRHGIKLNTSTVEWFRLGVPGVNASNAWWALVGCGCANFCMWKMEPSIIWIKKDPVCGIGGGEASVMSFFYSACPYSTIRLLYQIVWDTIVNARNDFLQVLLLCVHWPLGLGKSIEPHLDLRDLCLPACLPCLTCLPACLPAPRAPFISCGGTTYTNRLEPVSAKRQCSSNLSFAKDLLLRATTSKVSVPLKPLQLSCDLKGLYGKLGCPIPLLPAPAPSRTMHLPTRGLQDVLRIS